VATKKNVWFENFDQKYTVDMTIKWGSKLGTMLKILEESKKNIGF
jgi:hypothetical protein